MISSNLTESVFDFNRDLEELQNKVALPLCSIESLLKHFVDGWSLEKLFRTKFDAGYLKGVALCLVLNPKSSPTITDEIEAAMINIPESEENIVIPLNIQ